jgi:glycosyltransferase involved in cell wall biosynthesis
MCFFYSFPGGKILNRRRLFYTEHSVPEVNRISGMHGWTGALLFRETDGVIGVSKEITDAFRNKFRSCSHKFLCIPNSVDPMRFDGAQDRESIREELGLLPGHFVIGAVANFKKVKNHACLIRAFAGLSERHQEMRLVLTGRGDEEDPENSEKEISDLIKRLGLEGRVVITGYRNDVARLLKGFDLFCLPSFSEGLPMSLLEAMAAKIPVVGSDVRGIREVIRPMQTGLLFPSNDAPGLAQCLETLMGNRELRMGLSDNAHTYVSRRHCLQQWVATYERLLRNAS